MTWKKGLDGYMQEKREEQQEKPHGGNVMDVVDHLSFWRQNGTG
jgi:hypothetical protein